MSHNTFGKNSSKKNSLILISFSCLLLFIYFLFDSNLTTRFNRFKLNKIDQFIFESKCSCFKNKNVYVVKDLITKDYTIEYTDFLYDISYTKMKELNFTCDLYKSFKRGPGQKVVSYSLYGKKAQYYNLIQLIAKAVKKFYPNYIMRIYYDDSIDKSIICKYECLYENLDFCLVNNVQTKLDIDENMNKTSFNLNASYVHSMMWRWFPLGDSFVDTFFSRDLDSEIIKREVDSVKEWLNSSNIGHIMRGIL